MRIAKSTITKITNRLKKIGYEVIRNHGYQHSTAFVRAEKGKWVYVSADDSRPGEVLIRTAENEKDYSGGMNRFVPIDLNRNNFAKAMVLIDKLTTRKGE